MTACTFFGHRDCSWSLYPAVERAIRRMICAGVADFYVGGQGTFDAMALRVLRDVSRDLPWVRYTVVLPYLPSGREPNTESGETVFPEGLECAPRRFAIERRNLWMLDRCDGVIAYVNRSYGGAAKFLALAERQGKTILNLADEVQ